MTQVFKFNNNEVRITTIAGEPWWVAKDVCDVLGLTDTHKALIGLDEDEKSEYEQYSGSGRKPLIVNEPGLYSLIIRSRRPEAKAFKRWVTHEVLPSIRKRGLYATDELLSNPDLLIAAATELKRERLERQRLEDQALQNAPKVLFADSVVASDSSILIGDLAKILKQNGIETGERRLFEWLRNNGYLVRRKGRSYNMPTQRSMNLKLFEIEESVIVLPKGKMIAKTAKVTGKGQVYFIDRLSGSSSICMSI